MNAISIRCPTCNAALHVPNEATTVTCSYCHTPCRIQHRSRILQIPRPPAHDDRMPGRDGRAPMPVARVPVRSAAMVTVGALTAMMVVGAGAGYTMMRNAEVASSSRAASQPMQIAEAMPPATPGGPSGRPEMVHWNSSRPMLRDLDGDEQEDLIGVIGVYVNSTSLRHVAAYSGKDGHSLWRSALVPEAVGSQVKIALVGDRVLLSGDDGKLYAYKLEDGSPAWTLAVGEKVEMLCQLGDAGDGSSKDDPLEAARGLAASTRVRVVTKDERARDVQLAGGEATEITGKSRRQLFRACNQIPTDDDNTYGQVPYNPFHRLPNISDMYPRYTVRRGDVMLVSGGKAPGTGIPMVALREGRKVRWRAELPSSEPLTSQMDEKVIYFDSRVALATYATRSGSDGETRLVALSAEDGHRLWEAPLSSGPGSSVMSSVMATGKRAVAVSWTYAIAFDLETGKRVFSIGN